MHGKSIAFAIAIAGTTFAFACAVAAQAASIAAPGLPPPSNGWGASADLELIHGRHCTWQRGHRHLSACNRTRRTKVRPAYRAEPGGMAYENPRPGYFSYPNFPFWADKAFTEADERAAP